MSDPPIPELAPGETELVGRWAGGGARPDVWCTVTDRIYRLLPGLEVLCKGYDDRQQSLYRGPRDGRLWEFADLAPWDWDSECRLAVISPEEAIRRYPVRHEALHGLVLGLVQTGRLASEPALVRRNGAAMLADCGKSDRALGRAALAGLSEDEDAGVRLQALDALYGLDPDPPPPEAERRIRVLLAARPAAPELADRVLSASGPAGRRCALAAAPGSAVAERLWLLGTIAPPGPLTDEETALLRRSLADPAPEVRLQAAHVAGRLGGAGRVVVGDLLERLADEDPRVRRAALFAVGDVGPADGATLERLAALLTRPEAETRADAAVAFGKLGSAPEGVIERLGALLADAEASVRVQAVYALSRMGPRRPARRWLEGACADSNRRVREGAAAVLKALEGDRAATG